MAKVVRLPPGRVVHRVESPGFTVPPPQVLHPELMPPELLAAMRASWAAPRAGAMVEFHSLVDVYVVGEGLVFTRDFELLGPSVTQTPPDAVAQAEVRLREAVAAGTVARHEGPLVLCGKAGLNNYGHWLVEMLPRAGLSMRWIEMAGGWRVLVPLVYPWMAGVVADSLDLLGVGESRRVFARGEPSFVSELVFIEGLTRHGEYFSPLVLETMDRIAAQVAPAPYPLVWITREGDKRSLPQEAEANARIAAAGWHVAHPGRIGFREQVALGQGAREMAGVNGAGLSNLLFMAAGSGLTTFMPSAMPDIFYWQLAAHRGVRYREVRSAILPGHGGATGWDGPLGISVEEVLEELQRVAS